MLAPRLPLTEVTRVGKSWPIGAAKMAENILLSWSGGKDSARALYEIQQSGEYSVAALLSTVTEDHDRVSMHGVRRELLERQAEAIGLPLEKVYISKDASNREYEARMQAVLECHRREGVISVAFGDIFLEDLRRYREKNLGQVGMRAIFPIWKKDSAELARTFIELGFKAVVVCVDARHLDESFAGKMLDSEFLQRLPASVDPCGENGEFHSFVFDGPIFPKGIMYRLGETVRRDAFWFSDLLPA
jgi:uncharacterized protein (TIGR00290 family)